MLQKDILFSALSFLYILHLKYYIFIVKISIFVLN